MLDSYTFSQLGSAWASLAQLFKALMHRFMWVNRDASPSFGLCTPRSFRTCCAFHGVKLRLAPPNLGNLTRWTSHLSGFQVHLEVVLGIAPRVVQLEPACDHEHPARFPSSQVRPDVAAIHVNLTDRNALRLDLTQHLIELSLVRFIGWHDTSLQNQSLIQVPGDVAFVAIEATRSRFAPVAHVLVLDTDLTILGDALGDHHTSSFWIGFEVLAEQGMQALERRLQGGALRLLEHMIGDPLLQVLDLFEQFLERLLPSLRS